MIKRTLTEEQKEGYARRAREYRARKKNGEVLPEKTIQKTTSTDRVRAFRERKKLVDPVGMMEENKKATKRYRKRKKFRKYCEENLIVCPPHIDSIEGLLEWVGVTDGTKRCW